MGWLLLTGVLVLVGGLVGAWLSARRRAFAVKPGAMTPCRKHSFGVGVGEACPICGTRVEFKEAGR